jgi:GrpB-like predicted nucleotidyltransferase (UPF0157 family)
MGQGRVAADRDGLGFILPHGVFDGGLQMDGIEIVDYDPRWPALFDDEAKRLRATLDPSLIVGLEHFGSTSIPGLSAKPIIDIPIAVRSFRHFQNQLFAEGAPMISADGDDRLTA